MNKRILKFFILLIFILVLFPSFVLANDLSLPALNISVGQGGPAEVATSLQLLFYITIIGLAPTLLLMVTCFTRIIVVFHFLRSAMATQQMPPNQILIGIALFLTLFLMGPIFTQINDTALKPYSDGLISTDEAIKVGMEPIRDFMFKQVEPKDLALFVNLSGQTFEDYDQIPNEVLIPAFVLGELTKGFKMGFFIYLPFLVIDMVVASTLMAMGMMMLPPAMISLPFKLLVFVYVDGWSLLIHYLILTFK